MITFSCGGVNNQFLKCTLFKQEWVWDKRHGADVFFLTLTSRHKSKQTEPHTQREHVSQTRGQLVSESALQKMQLAIPKMSD